jgi:hypothetical protein
MLLQQFDYNRFLKHEDVYFGQMSTHHWRNIICDAMKISYQIKIELKI